MRISFDYDEDEDYDDDHLLGYTEGWDHPPMVYLRSKKCKMRPKKVIRMKHFFTQR